MSFLRKAGADSSVSFMILSHLVGPNNHKKPHDSNSSPSKWSKSSIFYPPLILNSGSWRCWSQSQLILGRRRGPPWTGRRFISRPPQKNNHPHPRTPTESLETDHIFPRDLTHLLSSAAHPKGTSVLGKWLTKHKAPNVYFDKLILQNNLFGSTFLLDLCKNINNTITVFQLNKLQRN